MKGQKPLFASFSTHWKTPQGLYRELDKEFHFTLDPCGLGQGGLWGKEVDGLLVSWKGERIFCNPPYGPQIEDWLRRATEADVAVYLLPARTDTQWWHRYVMKADEIRFIRGRLKFGNAVHSAPFPSVIVVYWRTSNV